MTVPRPGPPRPAPPEQGSPRPAAPDVAVAAAMAGLEGLADRPLAEHVEAFERVHTALSDALAAGEAPGRA